MLLWLCLILGPKYLPKVFSLGKCETLRTWIFLQISGIDIHPGFVLFQGSVQQQGNIIIKQQYLMKQENNIKNRKTYIIAYIYIIMSYVYNHIFVYIYIYISKKIELFLDFHASHVSRQSMPAIDVAEKNAPSQSLKLCPAQLVEIPSGHQLWPDEKKLHPLRPRYGKKYTKKTYKLHIMV